MGCLFTKLCRREKKPDYRIIDEELETFEVSGYLPPQFLPGDTFITFGDAIITNLDETGRIVNKNDN